MSIFPPLLLAASEKRLTVKLHPFSATQPVSIDALSTHGTLYSNRSSQGTVAVSKEKCYKEKPALPYHKCDEKNISDTQQDTVDVWTSNHRIIGFDMHHVLLATMP